MRLPRKPGVRVRLTDMNIDTWLPEDPTDQSTGFLGGSP
jgi:hypothetical protein